jgi:hypothetical protein
MREQFVGVNILNKHLAAVVALLVSGAASAGCNNYTCEDVKITVVVTIGDGNVLIRTDGNQSSLDCTQESGVYMTLLASSARFKEIYANVLAFQIAKLPMSFRVNIGSTGCTLAYVYGNTP